jgi:hypothetical protein
MALLDELPGRLEQPGDGDDVDGVSPQVVARPASTQ